MNTNRQAVTIVASPRIIAIAAGVLYLITHVTSIPALILYAPILNNVNYIVGSGPDTRVLLGAFADRGGANRCRPDLAAVGRPARLAALHTQQL